MKYCSLAPGVEDLRIEHPWIESFHGAVTVYDRKGVNLEMNPKPGVTFVKVGGPALPTTWNRSSRPPPASSCTRTIPTTTHDLRLNRSGFERTPERPR